MNFVTMSVTELQLNASVASVVDIELWRFELTQLFEYFDHRFLWVSRGNSRQLAEFLQGMRAKVHRMRSLLDAEITFRVSRNVADQLAPCPNRHQELLSASQKESTHASSTIRQEDGPPIDTVRRATTAVLSAVAAS